MTTNTPAAKPVTFDLDRLEREGETPAPFKVKLDGKQYVLRDPKSAAWGDLVYGIPGMHALAAMVDESQREEFGNKLRKLPNWKVTAVAKAYNEHFAVPDSPEDDGSPTS